MLESRVLRKNFAPFLLHVFLILIPEARLQSLMQRLLLVMLHSYGKKWTLVDYTMFPQVHCETKWSWNESQEFHSPHSTTIKIFPAVRALLESHLLAFCTLPALPHTTEVELLERAVLLPPLSSGDSISPLRCFAHLFITQKISKTAKE